MNSLQNSSTKALNFIRIDKKGRYYSYISKKNYSLFINKMLALLMMILLETESCEPDQILEEGLICCNNNICNEYCYKDSICIKSKRVWFCFQNGIIYFCLIKFLPSIIFTLIGIFIRFLYNKCNDYLKVIIRAIVEFVFNIFSYFMIGFFICYKNEIFMYFAVTIGIFAGPSFYSTFEFSLSCKNFMNNYNNKHVNSLSYHIRFFKGFKKLIVMNIIKICIFICTFSGYYMVFDAFAYALNRRYRYEFDNAEINYF